MKQLIVFWKGFLKGMKLFGSNITMIINCILLSIVYVVGVGISALLSLFSKKKHLETSSSKKKSYWEPMRHKKVSMEEHYRQF